MEPIFYDRDRFPVDVIRHAVWLYFRFTLSLCDVEEMMAVRGIDVAYETIRCWTLKFGQTFAQNLRRSRPSPSPRWHVDEMVVRIRGQQRISWGSATRRCCASLTIPAASALIPTCTDQHS
jgi:putative transposase